MEKSHIINTIYRATEGEGIFLGRPQVFVRYQGCAVGCLNCDSKDTWDFNFGDGQSVESILAKVHTEAINGLIKNVSITGGDPLHPKHVPHVIELVKGLKDRHYYINIEAAGTRIVDEIFDLVDFVSFDLKTPSTGVKTPIDLIEKMNSQYAGKFQIKAVIETEQDFLYTHNAYLHLQEKLGTIQFPWVLTPSFNNSEDFPMDRFARVMTWNEHKGGPFRVIGQQHKWIFGPDQKQV